MWSVREAQWRKTTSHLDSSHVMLSRFSCVWLFATPRTVAHQALPSMAFSMQEYWKGLPGPPPGDLPHPGTEPESHVSPALQADSSLLSYWRRPLIQVKAAANVVLLEEHIFSFLFVGPQVSFTGSTLCSVSRNRKTFIMALEVSIVSYRAIFSIMILLFASDRKPLSEWFK